MKTMLHAIHYLSIVFTQIVHMKIPFEIVAHQVKKDGQHFTKKIFPRNCKLFAIHYLCCVPVLLFCRYMWIICSRHNTALYYLIQRLVLQSVVEHIWSTSHSSILHFIKVILDKKKSLAQQSCARKAGFLFLLKQQFSFSLKHKY